MSKNSPTQISLSQTRSKSRSKSRKNSIVSIGHDGEMGSHSGRGARKYHTKKNNKKRRTKHCRCKRICKCAKKCKCKKNHTKKNRKKYKKKLQKGGRTRMLTPSNYPNPFPKGGPYNPGSLTNGLGKGFFYKNNTDPSLPNPKSTNSNFKQSGGGVFNLAENVPGASDLLDNYWKGVTGAKNVYQSWIGGQPYPSPDPTVQPIENVAPSNYSPIDIPAISKQSELVALKFN